MAKTGINPGRKRQLERLMGRLGLTTLDAIRWDLLDLALTHSTAAAVNYEQLEFFGDAVIRLFVAQLLWQENPSGNVGEWSAVRSVLVCDRILSTLAHDYGVERFLTLGPSAMGDTKGATSRLADAFEAILGALYLSTEDFSLIEPWLQPRLQQEAAAVRADPAYQNYKAALQQWTQAHYRERPEYRVQEVESQAQVAAAPHKAQQRFAAEVWLLGECVAVGTGHSIKAAEKAAAQLAYAKLTAG